MIDGSIDHIAIAVRSIPAALSLVVDALGGSFLFAGDNGAQGFRWAQFRYPGGGKIELVQPLDAEGFVGRFLERRGEGVHHMTFKVPDIHRAIDHVRAQGIEPVNVSTGDPEWKEAFLHPKSAHGVLIQLAQSAFSDEDAARHHLTDHGGDEHRHLRYEDLFA